MRSRYKVYFDLRRIITTCRDLFEANLTFHPAHLFAIFIAHEHADKTEIEITNYYSWYELIPK